MNYELFQSMTEEEARAYLTSFREFGAAKAVKILEPYTHFTLELDFSVESLSPTFTALLSVLKTVPKPVDPGLPQFIRESETYRRNLFEFDEPSNPILLAAAYYFGETFVRTYATLCWKTGNPKLHQCNMPVVSGFTCRLELPAILVTENIFASILAEMEDSTSIEKAIETWNGFVLTPTNGDAFNDHEKRG